MITKRLALFTPNNTELDNFYVAFSFPCVVDGFYQVTEWQDAVFMELSDEDKEKNKIESLSDELRKKQEELKELEELKNKLPFSQPPPVG